MEMDLNKLSRAALPEGERKFLDALQDAMRVFYATQFYGEQAVNITLARAHDNWNRYPNVTILRIGSGGRLEGGALGDTELIVLTKPAEDERDFPTDQLSLIAQVLQRPVPIGSADGPLGQRFISVSDVEHRSLASSDPLSFYPGVSTPYPGRMLESEFIAGSRSLWREARVRVFQEIFADAKILRGMKDELKRYAKTCNSGMIRFKGEHKQFDLETDRLFYDPASNRSGFKYGPIRYGQTALALDIFSLINRRGILPAEIADLPQGVEERCRYCLRRDWVEDVDRMITFALAYTQCLDAQTQAKARYDFHGETEIALSKGVVRHAIDGICGSLASSLLRP